MTEVRGIGATRSGRLCTVVAALMAALVLSGQSAPPRLPDTLAGTGLYADPAGLTVDPRHIAFTPQYPLWTDGATKRRWISLPSGTAINGSDPDAWVFPTGTRLWKEFAFGDRRVETRYLERSADGRWLYGAYAWSADGRTARLVSARGQRAAYPLPGNRSHAIPGLADCHGCHESGRSEVLGFSAIQLSPDRDSLALHAETVAGSIDLAALIERGLLVGAPDRQTRPRIAAASPTERAALGYLHGNCGHCHNETGPLRNLGLVLRQPASGEPAAVLASTLDQPLRKPAPGQSPQAVARIAPGSPNSSALVDRVSSRAPALQMPPLGTELVDDEAVALLKRWVAGLGERRAIIHPNQTGARQ